MKLPMDKIWDVLINKAHVGIAVICQGVLIYLDRTGHAVGASTQQTVNWFYMFLAGHFGASQVWPDKTNAPADPGAGDPNAKQ